MSCRCLHNPSGLWMFLAAAIFFLVASPRTSPYPVVVYPWPGRVQHFWSFMTQEGFGDSVTRFILSVHNVVVLEQFSGLLIKSTVNPALWTSRFTGLGLKSVPSNLPSPK